ncbi:MAG: zinc ribbon domain-containing protein, partial [Proteobacteria bacterium]|nr:zinc ribbon domain-containing protein [Pseudomonadota bacterium]
MIRCSSCQHELPENSRFCGYCGAKVENKKPAETGMQTLAGISISDLELFHAQKMASPTEPLLEPVQLQEFSATSEEAEAAPELTESQQFQKKVDASLDALLDSDSDKDSGWDDIEKIDFNKHDTIIAMPALSFRPGTPLSASGQQDDDAELQQILDENKRAIQDRMDAADASRNVEEALQKAEDNDLRETEAALREAGEAIRREAEEQARKDAEEAAKREAEERALREAKERTQREAEERARRDAEEKARREAEEKA